MKKIQYLFATIVLGLSLSSCGDSFLTQYPEGGTLLQDQYDKLPDALQGSIMGIYSKLYEYSDHDELLFIAISPDWISPYISIER